MNPSEMLIQRLAWLKRHDRPLKDWQFVGIVASLVSLEAWTLRAFGVPREFGLPLVVLSAYVPCNFLFFCNVVGVGNFRELIWMACFVLLCGASLVFLGGLNLPFILGFSLALTVHFCLRALKDPYCRYRKGLRLLDGAGRVVDAVRQIERAAALAPEVARYRYHLGRAYLRAGRESEGRALVLAALGEEPGLLDALRKGLLFKDEWIV
ncbi:MAG: tetratricopeptide repeat protein [Elusimicrobia bacterium]|nr:tetratricopeptide repeat protein [Elusimicrobiota bacterium]